MAVVFISPKHRQKMFFLGITVILLFVLVGIFFGVFLAEPKESSLALVFNKPKVNIDMSVFESYQFKNLQPFSEMQMQYSYTAATKKGKAQSGFIFAGSEDEARKALTDMGLIISSIKKVEIGRSNPFEPYYQATIK